MNRRQLAILAAILLAIALFFILDLQRFLTLEELQRNRRLLQEYRAAHRFAMAAGFVLLYIVQSALSLPGALVFSLAAGAIFGTAAGTVYAVTSAALGATLAFLLTRYLFRDLVQSRFGRRLAGVNRELEQRGFSYLLFLRLVPVFPFFLINLAAGLTSLPLRTFFIATVVGIIPGGFVFVNAGAALASLTTTADIASPRLLASFAALGLFALLPAIYGKIKDHRNRIS